MGLAHYVEKKHPSSSTNIHLLDLLLLACCYPLFNAFGYSIWIIYPSANYSKSLATLVNII